MLCYCAPVSKLLEDHTAFICGVKQSKSTASLGSLAIKLVLLAEPRLIYMLLRGI
jgi:hypothetical protein